MSDDRPYCVDVRSERGCASGWARTEAEARALAAELADDLRHREAEPVRYAAGWAG